MNLSGKDYVFQKATGDAEWWEFVQRRELLDRNFIRLRLVSHCCQLISAFGGKIEKNVQKTVQLWRCVGWLICVFNEECLEDSVLGCNCMKLYSKYREQDVNDKRSSVENCIPWTVQCFDARLLRLLQFTIRPVISASNMQRAVVKNPFDVSLFSASISWKCAKIFQPLIFVQNEVTCIDRPCCCCCCCCCCVFSNICIMSCCNNLKKCNWKTFISHGAHHIKIKTINWLMPTSAWKCYFMKLIISLYFYWIYECLWRSFSVFAHKLV